MFVKIVVLPHDDFCGCNTFVAMITRDNKAQAEFLRRDQWFLPTADNFSPFDCNRRDS